MSTLVVIGILTFISMLVMFATLDINVTEPPEFRKFKEPARYEVKRKLVILGICLGIALFWMLIFFLLGVR